MAAIWIGLPQVSSKTAVTTGPISVASWVKLDAYPLKLLDLGMDVVDGELGERDAVVDQGLLQRTGRRVAVRLQQQLDAVRDGGEATMSQRPHRRARRSF